VETLKWLEVLADQGDLEFSRHEGQIYYRANPVKACYAAPAEFR
jgi:hypothetical protein